MISGFFGEHRWLSNFWPCSVRWGITCPSVEHAYQAAKALNGADRVAIGKCSSPAQAKAMGRKVRQRPDWDSIKLRVMEHLLRQKFAAGTDIAARLLGTGDQELVEGNTWGDRFWGVCGGSGENHLGRLLMEIRDSLRGGT